eukprot:CAMPEP_0206225478 /NCGR_PEP_ID=MMETSP0047_2-20121206/7570_1 /ASSEMBLY_ACC=CAM_ASM_000192 /TAXON_ID=195065 /ORGANISM="Chroomonas mesostigmatica_cf, Strain CCMP1168" /LENGTH=61 /DNA_ID=CAMNT_0053648483 /DNA_START=27 /DNA_END=208 /DNA_ORIENTATION=-
MAADEGQLLWRIQNFVTKRGGTATAEDVQSVFGQDETVAPWLTDNGGAVACLKAHPEIFAV